MDLHVQPSFQAGDHRRLQRPTSYERKRRVIADRSRISDQAYKGIESNGLRKGIIWPKVPTKEQLPPAFIILWKIALNKCFINHASSIDRRISTGISLGNWVDQEVGGKWVWWPVPG